MRAVEIIKNSGDTRPRQGAIYFGAVLIMLMPGMSAAQVLLYISPGLQIGFTPKQKVFLSAQVTVGSAMVGMSYEDLVFSPGITMGYRWSRKETMKYLDVQIAALFFGAGLGKAWVMEKGTDADVITGFRFKAWGGGWINVTYDRYKDKNATPVHNFGLIGVLPIPVLLVGEDYLLGA